MKTIRSFTVMPPDGDMYGFPKKFTPYRDGDFYTWLINCGYPVHKIARATQIKMSNIEYYEDAGNPLIGERID